jgi:hypothetical protein
MGKINTKGAKIKLNRVREDIFLAYHGMREKYHLLGAGGYSFWTDI